MSGSHPNIIVSPLEKKMASLTERRKGEDWKEEKCSFLYHIACKQSKVPLLSKESSAAMGTPPLKDRMVYI